MSVIRESQLAKLQVKFTHKISLPAFVEGSHAGVVWLLDPEAQRWSTSEAKAENTQDWSLAYVYRIELILQTSTDFHHKSREQGHLWHMTGS